MGFPGLSGKRGLSNAQVVFQFKGTRNFNTDPLTIPNLRGDLYDYEIITWRDTAFIGGNASNTMHLNLNGDVGSNYRYYDMTGLGNKTAGSSTEALTSIFVLAGDSAGSPTALSRLSITGESGSERYISTLYAGRHVTAVDQVQTIVKDSFYWRNTVDELTSMVLSAVFSASAPHEVTVIATPKDSTQETWELMKIASFTSVNSVSLFTGLDGDRDKVYKVAIKYSETGGLAPGLRFNADAGNTYTTQSLHNTGAALGAAKDVTTKALFMGFLNPTDPDVEIIIQAESGVERLASISTADQGGAFNDPQGESGSWWSNTVDNLDEIGIAGMNSGTGTAKLYRKQRPNHASDTLPWEVIGEVAVSGDFSAGHTFSGLQGDLDFMYRLEWSGDGNGQLLLQQNADGGTNYFRQRFTGSLAVVSAAAAASQTSLLFVDTGGAGFVNRGDALFYPKSGEQRPYILRDWNGENEVNLRAGWWTNTVDAITSLKVFASNTNVFTGTLRLSRIRI